MPNTPQGWVTSLNLLADKMDARATEALARLEARIAQPAPPADKPFQPTGR